MFKVNFAFRFILRNAETGALQYHHPSANNNLVLEQPFLVSNQADLERLYHQISNIDFLEWVRQQRPNSKWMVDLITNVSWFVWKIRDHPIGRGKYLPGFIAESRGIDAVENNAKTGKPYEDTLCIFRCLALYNNMQTFEDFFVWYNNLDVVPFIEAVEKMSQFWRERKIDMFKDGISVPGLTLKYLFSYLSPQTYFSLFDQANSDLYHLIKDNNTGGPSIIFHRYHEAGKTKIREAEEGEAAKPCEKIVGYDANALYLWALMQNMPTGSYTRRLADIEFKSKSSVRMAIEWLEWVAHKEGIHIRHQLNSTEKRIGGRKLPVDGFNAQTQTVYHFSRVLLARP